MKTGWQLIFTFWSKRKCTYCCKQVERMYTNREVVDNRGSRYESRKDQVSQDMTVSDVKWRHGLNRFHSLRHLQMTHAAPYLRRKILHKHCFQFLLGRLWYPGEMKNKGYAKFWGVWETCKWRMRESLQRLLTKISVWISLMYTHVLQVVSLISIGGLKGIFQVT